MPQPSDKAATRCFLGIITYLSKFCPNLSEVVCPLRDLTHIKQDFLWSDQHTKAFKQAKELFSKAPCLRYFNVHAPVVLQVDASEYGLGAALLQPATNPTNSCNVQWQPVAYSSSSLSPTEQRYAQIEKETLAIVHAFHKFDQLLFGKSDVTVHSDHKPLETIFKRPLASAPRCLQSMMLTLQRYTFHVEYRKGSTPHIADTLSRAPLPTTSHKQVHDELVYRVKFESSNPDLTGFQDATLQDIKTEACTDSEQIIFQSLISTGWPNDKAAVPELARPYWSVHHELPLMMACSSNRIASSSPLPSVKASYTNSMQLIAALSSLFAMLATVCSGRVLTVKLQTCANHVPHVLNMLINTLENHFNPTQYLLYPGSFSPKTCLNSMVYHI